MIWVPECAVGRQFVRVFWAANAPSIFLRLTRNFGVQFGATEHLQWLRRLDLNQRPKDYEPSVLPLNYAAKSV